MKHPGVFASSDLEIPDRETLSSTYFFFTDPAVPTIKADLIKKMGRRLKSAQFEHISLQYWGKQAVLCEDCGQSFVLKTNSIQSPGVVDRELQAYQDAYFCPNHRHRFFSQPSPELPTASSSSSEERTALAICEKAISHKLSKSVPMGQTSQINFIDQFSLIEATLYQANRISEKIKDFINETKKKVVLESPKRMKRDKRETEVLRNLMRGARKLTKCGTHILNIQEEMETSLEKDNAIYIKRIMDDEHPPDASDLSPESASSPEENDNEEQSNPKTGFRLEAIQYPTWSTQTNSEEQDEAVRSLPRSEQDEAVRSLTHSEQAEAGLSEVPRSVSEATVILDEDN